MAKQKKVLFTTPVGTAAYAYFHKPDTGKQYSNNKHKGDLILDGDVDLSKCEELCRQVAAEEYPDVDLSELQLPFKSGDGHKNEEFHGKVIFKAASKYKPQIIDTKRKDLPKGVLAQSGDRVRFVVALKPWTKTEEVKVRENGKQVTVKETVYGVTAYLQIVQLVEKRAGGGGMDMLDDIDGFDADDFTPPEDGDDLSSGTDDNGGDF